MNNIIKNQIDSIKHCKFFKSERVAAIINSTTNTQLICMRLLEYENELIKLENDDNLKGFDNFIDYDEEFEKINEELSK
jgi:hypothetical protein